MSIELQRDLSFEIFLNAATRIYSFVDPIQYWQWLFLRNRFIVSTAVFFHCWLSNGKKNCLTRKTAMWFVPRKVANALQSTGSTSFFFLLSHHFSPSNHIKLYNYVVKKNRNLNIDPFSPRAVRLFLKKATGYIYNWNSVKKKNQCANSSIWNANGSTLVLCTFACDQLKHSAECDVRCRISARHLRLRLWLFVNFIGYNTTPCHITGSNDLPCRHTMGRIHQKVPKAIPFPAITKQKFYFYSSYFNRCVI